MEPGEVQINTLKGKPAENTFASGITGRKVWNWFHDSLEKQSNFRKESQRDCNYYDNEQWTQEEINELKDRNQPVITINRIKPTIDLVLGAESKAKVEFVAAPRNDVDIENASIATESLKYIMDQNEGEYICAEAFENSVKAGWYFVEICENDDPFGEVVQLNGIDRSDLVWDPYAKNFDLNDGKYEIRGKWLELDDAIGKFPQHKETLESAVGDQTEDEKRERPYHGTEDQADRPGVVKWDDPQISSLEWVDRERKRVRLLECWYKVPAEILIVENDLTGDVEELDPNQLMDILATPGTRITKVNVQKVRVCIVAGSTILEDNPSPYKHNRFPFIPFWGFRKDKDKAPYGLVRQIRDMQDEINKRRSKALHLLNTRQIVATNDSIDQKINDWDEVAEEVSRPDGRVVLEGKAIAKGAKFEIVNQDRAIQEQFQYGQEAKNEIEELTGIGEEMKGLPSNATSGKAILARQSQGFMMLGKLFENYRRSKQILGNLIWATIQQFWTKPKIIRITDKMGQYDFLEVNRYVMDDSQRILIHNDISQAKVDIIIDEQPFHASIRQALLEQMMDMVAKLPPDIGIMMLDLVVGYSDMPKAPEMVARIQQIQGIMTAKQLIQEQQQAEGNNGKGKSESTNPGKRKKTYDRPIDEGGSLAGVDAQIAGA